MSLDMSSMKKILPVLLICLLMLAGGTALYVPDVAAQAPAAAEAAPAPLKADPGDTAWLLTSSALVMLMTLPGLALFYGGLTRSKNILSTLMHCFITLCFGSIMWVLFGYSLSFGPDVGGVIGNLDWVGLRGVGVEPHPTYGPTIPHELFMVFQLMFAAYYPGADRRSPRRASQVLRVAGVCRSMDDRGILSCCPLGLGWRMVGSDGRIGLCRRHGRACHLRNGGPGCLHCPRETSGLSDSSYASQ